MPDTNVLGIIFCYRYHTLVLHLQENHPHQQFSARDTT